VNKWRRTDMKAIKIVGIGLIVVLVAVGIIGLIPYDMDNRAHASETLNPNGTAVGNSLVVYDPSITGNTKEVATIIARELQLKGYKVDLAGIKSEKAQNISPYNLIIIGGPIYGGIAGAEVKSYLETLKPLNGTKIGVFATGDPHTTDPEVINEKFAPVPQNSFQIDAVMVVSRNDDKNKKCAEFVDKLLK
jgi:flavodoxin